MHATLPLLQVTNFPMLRRRKLESLQVNLGYRCNQSCLHCHVNAGPTRTEEMTLDTVNEILACIDANNDIQSLDLTGGAPELNPHFRYFVSAAAERNIKTMDRCNLTILNEPGQEDLAVFLAENKVEIIASLPCYLEDNVNQQRGKGTYQASLVGLKTLNELGYGHTESGLVINLVYNPLGPQLPPSQKELEQQYKQYLFEKFGIIFNHLFTLTNMPINRFGSTLVSKKQFGSYMKLLHEAHSESNSEHVMCRNMISIDWQGYVYDCDFNQQLGLGLLTSHQKPLHIRDISVKTLLGRHIRVADHCYGCTAGQGSSCGGALEAVVA